MQQANSAVLGVFMMLCIACSTGAQIRTDCSPDGSVWLTMARISFAENVYHERSGRFGTLPDLTDLQPGLPADLMNSGKMGSYRISVEVAPTGYIARANPRPGLKVRVTSFYADETGKITINRSGAPAGPHSMSMDPRFRTAVNSLPIGSQGRPLSFIRSELP